MRPRWLRTVLTWMLTLSLLAGLLLGIYWIHREVQEERLREAEAEKSKSGKSDRPARPAPGIVELEEDEAERYGLEVQTARPVKWYERVLVYGRVVPNPRATTAIRSPFAGLLRASPASSWPALGQRVRAGQKLGWVDVRVGPEVRLDLEHKLADARIRQKGAEEEVKLQKSRADSLTKVTSQIQLQSRAELDAALIQLAQARNQLATARASAELWEKALREVEQRKDGAKSPWSRALVAPTDGVITELAGRPGMPVEAGTPVLTLVDFRRPLVRLDLPPEVLARSAVPRQVEVQLAAVSSLSSGGTVTAVPSLEVQLAGPAPRADVTSQFIGYWYDAHLPPTKKGGTDALWRPGMQVTAEVPTAGAVPQSAVVVPAGAVLYHEGRPLVYVRIESDKYQRREVRLLGRQGDNLVLVARKGKLPVGVAAGENVVTREAQVLLSKEFLSAAPDND